MSRLGLSIVFFFNDTATTEIYTLSLHDALPIWGRGEIPGAAPLCGQYGYAGDEDRKSTRLNSSHANTSYAVFCLKKKKHTKQKYSQRKKESEHQQPQQQKQLP